MAIRITVSGKGTLGDTIQGWSASEYATPVAIGEAAQGTGSVTVSGRSTDDSLLLVSNDIETVHEDLEGNLGSIRGVVRTVSEAGAVANVTHSNLLERFDADRFVPALQVGSLWSAVDIGIQLTGPSRIAEGVL